MQARRNTDMALRRIHLPSSGRDVVARTRACTHQHMCGLSIVRGWCVLVGALDECGLSSVGGKLGVDGGEGWHHVQGARVASCPGCRNCNMSGAHRWHQDRGMRVASGLGRKECAMTGAKEWLGVR